MAITRLAQLDIGFSRSRHTISVLEMQSGLPRGHLSEFTALYSSLSTRYRFEFEQNDAQLLPMVLFDNLNRSPASLADEPLQTMYYQRGFKTEVEGFPVQSNSTGLLHSERMVDIGGSLSGRWESASDDVSVDNQSPLELHDAVVIARRDDAFYVGYAAELDSGRNTIHVETKSFDALIRELIRRESIRAKGDEYAGRVSLCMIRAALFSLNLDPGEVRLIANLDQPVSPMICYPKETQSSGVSVVVAHLRYPPPNKSSVH